MALTIMLIDNDKDEHLFFSMALERLETQVNLLRVNSAAEALEELAKETEVHYIFFDLEMPAMDGFEFVASLRQTFGFNHTAIAFTTSSFIEDRNKVLQAGADDFITKPASLHLLTVELQRILQSFPQPAAI